MKNTKVSLNRQRKLGVDVGDGWIAKRSEERKGIYSPIVLVHFEHDQTGRKARATLDVGKGMFIEGFPGKAADKKTASHQVSSVILNKWRGRRNFGVAEVPASAPTAPSLPTAR